MSCDYTGVVNEQNHLAQALGHRARRRLWVASALVATCALGCSFDKSGIQGDHHQFVIDSLVFPSTPATVMQYGFDIDGAADGSVDNALGTAIADLGVADLVQNVMDVAVARGSATMLANVQTTSLVQADLVGVDIYMGTNPSKAPCSSPGDLACGNHLDGQTSFDIDPTGFLTGTLEGEIVDGVLRARPGELTLEIQLVEAIGPVRLQVSGATVEIALGDGIASGRIGGGVTEQELSAKLGGAITALVELALQADCPFSGPLAELCDFDIQEIVASQFGPDVDLLDAAGNFHPLQDGQTESYSLGMAFSAVGCNFEQI